MKGQSFIDTFCRDLKAKYRNTTSLTVENIGGEYARVLMGETLLGQRLLSEKFVGVYLPYPELQGFHYASASGQLMIVFDRSDTAWEQLRTKLHELGEYILSRLSVIWPNYGKALSYLQEAEGDAVPDRFANGVLAKLMPTHLEVTARMLTMRLGLNFVNMFLATWVQMMECFLPGGSAYLPREIIEMPQRLDVELIAFYQHVTEYILLQERENSLSAEEIQGESCPEWVAAFEHLVTIPFNGGRRS